MAQKNATLRGRIEGTLYDLIPRGSIYNIYVDDTTTLAAKLQEMVTSLNGKVTREQLEAALEEAAEGKDNVTAENIKKALGYTPADAEVVRQLSSLNVDLSGYAKETWVQEGFQPKGNYLTSVPTAQQVGADPVGTATSAVSGHNTSGDAHNDIRLELKAIADRLSAFLDSDDVTLDQLSELIKVINSNKTLIEAITTSKVSVTDIINNLNTNVTNKPLSAAQGVELKRLYDELSTGKLDAAKLTEAINTALAQAKSSGEFDGKTPVKGVDYYTEADKVEMVADVIAALPDASEVKY